MPPNEPTAPNRGLADPVVRPFGYVEDHQLIRRAGSLLVHRETCVSRSNALLGTALTAEECVPLRDSLTTVQRYRPVAMPHPSLHELAVVYLAARSCSDTGRP